MAVQSELDDWFERNHCGSGCKVLTFRGADQTWFVVRHGQRKVREPSQADDGTSSTEFFRPQKYDVLLYDRGEDWIAVHAGSKRKIALYLKALGRIVFGDASYFTGGGIFTLSPLVESGAESMISSELVFTPTGAKGQQDACCNELGFDPSPIAQGFLVVRWNDLPSALGIEREFPAGQIDLPGPGDLLYYQLLRCPAPCRIIRVAQNLHCLAILETVQCSLRQVYRGRRIRNR